MTLKMSMPHTMVAFQDFSSTVDYGALFAYIFLKLNENHACKEVMNQATPNRVLRQNRKVKDLASALHW